MSKKQSGPLPATMPSPVPVPLTPPMPHGMDRIETIGRDLSDLIGEIHTCISAKCEPAVSTHDDVCKCIADCVNSHLSEIDLKAAGVMEAVCEAVTAELHGIRESGINAGCDLPNLLPLLSCGGTLPPGGVPSPTPIPPSPPTLACVPYPITPPPEPLPLPTVGGGTIDPRILARTANLPANLHPDDYVVWANGRCNGYSQGCVLQILGQEPPGDLYELVAGPMSLSEAQAWIAMNCIDNAGDPHCIKGGPPPLPCPNPVPAPVPVPLPLPVPVPIPNPGPPNPCPPCPPSTCPPPPLPLPIPSPVPPTPTPTPTPGGGGDSCVGVFACPDPRDPCEVRPIHVIVSFCKPKSDCENPDFHIGGLVGHKSCPGDSPLKIQQVDSNGNICGCPSTQPVVVDNTFDFGDVCYFRPPDANEKTWCCWVHTDNAGKIDQCTVDKCDKAPQGIRWSKKCNATTYDDAISYADVLCPDLRVSVPVDPAPCPPKPAPQPAPSPKPPPTVTYALPDWTEIENCDVLRLMLSGGVTPPAETVQHAMGLVNDAGQPTTPEWIDGGSGNKVTGFLMAPFLELTRAILNGVAWTLDRIPKGKNCNWGLLVFPVTWKAILGVIEKWTGADVEEFKRPYDYTRAYLCPTELPGIGEAYDCYLHGAITEDTWVCWVRANGLMESPARKILYARQERVSPEVAVKLHAAEKITTARRDTLIREGGWTNPANTREMMDSIIDYPGVGEIIRMMVRNAGDDTLAANTNADAEFAEKYVGLLQQWGRFNLIPDEIALRYWRAHWQIPGVSKLFEMLHRLRPGVVDDKLVMTPQAMGYGFQENEIHPFWRERLQAVSFSPLTRVDAQRAYFVGSIDRNQLKGAYQDIGYTADNAEVLAKFADKLRATRLVANRWVKLYAKGGITRAVALEHATADGLDVQAFTAELDNQDAIRKAQSRQTCVKSLRTRFLQGELTHDQTHKELIHLGLTADEADQLAATWGCERKAKGKHATAAQLCRWFKADLLTEEEYLARLERIGWDKADAARLAKDCKRVTRPRPGKGGQMPPLPF